MIDWPEMVLRLGTATLAGGLIGLNRDLHGKPIGLRTMSLVALASAMLLVLVDPSYDHVAPKNADAASRVMQGILTGIGFLGAGVIIRGDHDVRIRGLTSAACTWLVACIGIVCGIGQWRLVAIALVITFVVLIVGGPIERWLHRKIGREDDPAPKPPA